MTSSPSEFEHNRPRAAGDRQDALILNRSSLLDRCLGNQELAGRVLDKLADTLAQEQTRLNAALATSDFEQLVNVAHRLKGTAANTGAEALCQAAERLEAIAQRGDQTTAKQAIRVLDVNVQRVLEVIQATSEV